MPHDSSLAKLEWLRAHAPIFGTSVDDLSDVGLDDIVNAYTVLSKGAGFLMGMTITLEDRETLSVLLPSLERLGRSRCEELASTGRDGFAQIPWSVHTGVRAWLPPRPEAIEAKVASGVEALCLLAKSDIGGVATQEDHIEKLAVELLPPALEADQAAVESSLEELVPAPIEVMYRRINGLRVRVGDAWHQPIGRIDTLDLERDGLMFGSWGDGTKLYLRGKSVFVRPMVQGKKKPRPGKRQRLARDLGTFLHALAEARGYLPAVLTDSDVPWLPAPR